MNEPQPIDWVIEGDDNDNGNPPGPLLVLLIATPWIFIGLGILIGWVIWA